MRLLMTVLSCAWVLLGAACATQQVRPAPAVTANIPTEVALEFQRSVAAWNAGNLNVFLEIYADSATFALPDRFLLGRDAIRDFYAPSFQPGLVRDELAVEQFDVEVLGPEAALVRGIFRNVRNGQVMRRGTTTLVLRKIIGQWRIIHDHSN